MVGLLGMMKVENWVAWLAAQMAELRERWLAALMAEHLAEK